MRAVGEDQLVIASNDELCELVRTNDAVLLTAIEAILTGGCIPYDVTDRNVSVLAGSINAFPRRIMVGDCCIADARRLLIDAGLGHELQIND
jgi:hypothetical protein